ncbi:MAG: DUF4331 family protein [Bacteroidota bacterium]
MQSKWILTIVCLFTIQTIIFASSHREAPLIAYDPLADNVDVYAFRSPDNPNTVTLIATYIPMQLPHGGPNYYNFGENIRYEIHIDNDASTPGDDIIYRFTFTKVNEDPTTFFNIRLGAENQKTTYTLEKSTDGGNTFTAILMDAPVAPYNVGTRSITSGVGLGASSYSELMQSAIVNASTGERVFAGPTDDPFFVDLGGIFDLGDAPRQDGQAVDGLACFNVSALAIQVPISDLLKADAPSSPTSILDSDYVIGVWASASRKAMQTFSNFNAAEGGDWVQVSRLGMPLTNEAVIPVGMKDFWNAITPYEELAEESLDAFFYNPELALYMDDDQFGGAVPAFAPLRVQTNSLGAFDFSNGADGLFGLKGSDAVAGTALDDAVFGNLLLPGPGLPRSVDLWPAFHTGVPNVVPYQLATGKAGNPLAEGKPFVNNFLPNGGDMLRLNMAVPVTDRDDANFSSLGLIQAAVLGLLDPNFNDNTDIQFIPNMDGFPNGRRLEDDVTRIELQAVSGAVLAAIGLWYDDFDPNAEGASPVTEDLLGVLGYTTGIEANDRAFQATFPYLAMPFSGTSGCSGNTFSTTAADLSLAASVADSTYNQFQEVPYTITVRNDGPATATAVTVSAALPEGMVFTRSSVTQGKYNLFFEQWEVGTLEVGESATLNLTLFTLVDNTDLSFFTEVSSSMAGDLDSSPANGMANEDDEALVIITVRDNPNNGANEPSTLQIGANEQMMMHKVYPTPAQNQVQLVLESDMDYTAEVMILNQQGQVVQNRSIQLNQGFNNVNFDISNLVSGNYVISLEGLDGASVQEKIVVLK